MTSAAVEIEDDWVRVTEKRTGRRYDYRWRVISQSVTDLAVELVDSAGAVHLLRLADLPERPRHAIRAVLRRNLLPRCLSKDELDQLTSGTATMAGLIRVALIRAIDRLEAPDGDTLVGSGAAQELHAADVEAVSRQPRRPARLSKLDIGLIDHQRGVVVQKNGAEQQRRFPADPQFQTRKISRVLVEQTIRAALAAAAIAILGKDRKQIVVLERAQRPVHQRGGRFYVMIIRA